MIIYKITNKINGKVYIGQTTDSLSRRKSEHIQAATSGSKSKLYSAMRKYGVENFEFEQIDTANTKDELNYKEIKYIVEYDSVRTGYNMYYGGANNCMFDEDVKSHHRQVMQTDEVKKKISDSMKQYRKEHPWTDEQRHKFAESKYGNKNFAGHKLTESHKEALKKSHYKSVYCINEDGVIVKRFDTVKSAAHWWYNNGYGTVKHWYTLCDMIKRSNVNNRFIKGLKWVYEGGDNNEKVSG